MKTKARRFAIKLIAVLLGILLALVLAEVFYRVFHFATHRNLEDIQAGRLPVVQPDREMKLGQVIQISRHRKIVYELIPGSKYQFQGVPVQTNEQGFRDRNYLKIKRKGVRRIIGLGDSVMFGWGVTEQNCFLTQLENDLNRQDSFVFEILNTGVPGYNSVMEVATLREKIDLPGVDMVILNFVGNDLDLPNFIRKKPAYLGIKKSFILQRFEASDGMDGRLRAAPFDKKKGAYENRLENVPPEYQAFVGEPAFSAALQELRKMAQEHGFQVLVLSTDPTSPAPDFVKTACENAGFALLEMQPFWEKYQAENPGATWQLSGGDGHPNAVGHAVIAKALRGIIWQMTN